MSPTAAFRDGVRRVNGAPAVLAGTFALTLLVSMPLTYALRGMIAAHLGSSLAADAAASGTNPEWWREFQAQATGLGATFLPTISGFGAVLNNKTPERWQAAMIALGVACRKNADIPTAAARTLCDKRNRPEGPIKLPDECKPFYELMQLAKIIPRD